MSDRTAQAREAVLEELRTFLQREEMLENALHDWRSIHESAELRRLMKAYDHLRLAKSARKRRARARKASGEA